MSESLQDFLGYATKRDQIQMKIAITSGKGGTGKTTVSTGLFYVLNTYMNHSVQLLDCDVEEPNCNIFIKGKAVSSDSVSLRIPRVDTGSCTFCGKCRDVCAFQAIVMLPDAGFIEVITDMCHGCGACSYVCADHAIKEEDQVIGSIGYYNKYATNDFIEGRMQVGNALQTRVIWDTVERTDRKFSLSLYDAPPGTSCPVVAVISKADYVVMVTEPTPFGLHDLKLMVETAKQLYKEFGVVINKAGLNYQPLYEYLQTQKVSLLGEIPFKKEYAGAYSKGEILPEYDIQLKDIYIGIIKNILNTDVGSD